MSRLAVVSECSVVKCDSEFDSQTLGLLAPLGCGYLTGAGTITNVLCPDETSTVAILGTGTVGMAALLAAKALGVTKIIAVDIVDQKLELAASLGASHLINTKHNPDLSEAIRKYVPEGADFILDATGVPSVIQASLGALAHRGTFALVGAIPPGTQLQVDALDIMTGSKKIMGVIEAWSDPQEV